MKIRGINFPEPVLAAQKQSRLVIFAGAGVSIPAPSNHPDFRDLARRIAAGRLHLEDNQPVDQFLGQLHDLGVQVHSLAQQILNNEQSKPNSFHHDLLRLFDKASNIRLVTTNFDRHFSTASQNVFKDEPPCELYYAPSLPLGHSFSGIVYLHGSVERPADRLVLTDCDFGRAYLTEGWARLFLQRVFETFTVLFVGYSHNDPVMNYLARGFTPEMGKSNRFAIVPDDNQSQWFYRRVTPVTYQLNSDNNNRHGQLVMSLHGWADQSRQGTLDKEHRIKEIVSLPPPIDVEDSDFVQNSLSEVSTARFFARHADSILWLRWTEEKQLLTRLFDPRVVLDQIEIILTRWVAEKFLCQHPNETISLLRRQGERLNPAVWTAIALQISSAWRASTNRDSLRQWVAILLNLKIPENDLAPLAYLGASLEYPSDQDTAILLFEQLSRPVLYLKPDWLGDVDEAGHGKDTELEVRCLGHKFWLDKLFRDFFEPNLAVLSRKLEPIIHSHLQTAYFLSRIDRDSNELWDRLSLTRNSIEEQDGGRGISPVGTLVDAGRQVIRWNASQAPAQADLLFEFWLQADSHLLKRLAVYGVSLAQHWGADRKLKWLIGNQLLFRRGVKAEVFKVIKDAYGSCSQSTRRALIDSATEGPNIPIGAGEAATIAQYEIFNLITWIHASDPKCPIVAQALKALNEANPEFTPRNKPDQDVSLSPMQVGWQSPTSVEDIISKPPSDQFEFLVSYQSIRFLGPTRQGLLQNVASAAARDQQWGWQLATILINKALWGSDLWSALMVAWSTTEMSDDSWQQILTALVDHKQLLGALRADAARLLEQGVKRTTARIPSHLLSLADSLAAELWNALQEESAPSGPSPSNWLLRGINHPAGSLTLYWLSRISHQYQQQGKSWKGIPTPLKLHLETVVNGHSYAAQLGRALLASQLYLLVNADEPWTLDKILPLFDWLADGRRALQAFHGFLTWGRQTEALLPHLLPMYEKAFPHIEELGEFRSRFVGYLAGAALSDLVNPLFHGWLPRFLLNAKPQDHYGWALQVKILLESLSDSSKITAWEGWIKKYWTDRLSGQPVPLQTEELKEMVEWSVQLGPVFDDVVQLVLKSPTFDLQDSSVLRGLDENRFSERHPVSTALLLLRVLQNITTQYWDLDRADNVIRRITPMEVELSILLQLCDELARIGYPAAAELKLWIIAQRQTD